jgi:protein-S-isoprenylcysteine O-methyltransferase Ste14
MDKHMPPLEGPAGLPFKRLRNIFGSTDDARRGQPMPFSATIQSLLFLVVAAAALFVAAGTVTIVGFWIYLGIFTTFALGSLAIIEPELLRERQRPGGKSGPLGPHLFAFILLLHLIVAGLDRGRFHWSDGVPVWLQAAGLVALAAGFALAMWAMRVNRFFSSVVRIQSDRGQHVITTGPYAFVRHPGYVAGFLVTLASGFALGSWLAEALLVIPSVPGLVYRAVTEDRVLLAELPGYRDYANQVRWRLLPGIW